MTEQVARAGRVGGGVHVMYVGMELVNVATDRSDIVAMCAFFFSSRRRHTRLQGDWSSDVCSSDLAETRSAALPACSDGFDDIDGGPECRVYIQMRGVEQVCIRRRFQGGYGPRAVADRKSVV